MVSNDGRQVTSAEASHELNQSCNGKGSKNQAEPFDKDLYRQHVVRQQMIPLDQMNVAWRRDDGDARLLPSPSEERRPIEEEAEEAGWALLRAIDLGIFQDDEINRPSSPGVFSDATEPSSWEPETEE